jgi:predicted phage terminase large subunit-like protein
VVGEALSGTCVRGWDLAASENGGDWTVGVKLCLSAAGTLQVVDVVRLQGGPEAVVQAIRLAAERDGPEVRISLPQDPGQAGRSQVAFLTARLAGFRVVSSPESGAKATRAMPVASQANAGNLTLLRAGWNRVLLEEMQDFPGGAKDDQVDALARAYALLVSVPTPARQVRNGWTSR